MSRMTKERMKRRPEGSMVTLVSTMAKSFGKSLSRRSRRKSFVMRRIRSSLLKPPRLPPPTRPMTQSTGKLESRSMGNQPVA